MPPRPPLTGHWWTRIIIIYDYFLALAIYVELVGAARYGMEKIEMEFTIEFAVCCCRFD